MHAKHETQWYVTFSKESMGHYRWAFWKDATDARPLQIREMPPDL